MRAVVFFDSDGEIKSLALIHPQSGGTNPNGDQIRAESPQYESLEIEVEDITPDKLRDIHSQHRVDMVQRKLVRR